MEKNLASDFKKMEKWIMIVEIALDKHCIKNPSDKDMKRARSYVHHIRTKIRGYTGYSQSTIPTILKVWNNIFNKNPNPSQVGYVKRMYEKYI